MTETIIIAVIVGLALVFVGRRVYRNFKNTGDSACGCAGCPQSSSCASYSIQESPGKECPSKGKDA